MAGPYLRAVYREIDFLRHSPWNILCSVGVPIILVVAFAALFLGGTVRKVPIVVVDQDHSNISRLLEERLDAAPGISVVAIRTNLPNAMSDIRAKHAYGAFYIPHNTERDIKAAKQAPVIFYLSNSYLTAAGAIEREADGVVKSVAATVMVDEVARGNLRRAKAPPVSVQVTALFNSGASYEEMLTTNLQPAILAVCLTISVMYALLRALDLNELRAWINSPREIVPAMFGKITPYIFLYFLYGVVAIIWLAMHGDPVRGSYLFLLAGYGAMLIAYALFALFVTACVRDGPMTFGMCAIYCLSAFTASGAVFPLNNAILFTKTWSMLQPLTWYSQMLAQQWHMGVSVTDSVLPLAVLVFMIPVTTAAAYVGIRLVLHDAKAARP